MMSPESEHPQRAEVNRWIEQAQRGELAWAELGERLLGIGEPSGATNAHTPDLDRQRRCGYGEVIFGEGKSFDAIQNIAQRLIESGQTSVLVTRIDARVAASMQGAFPFSRYDPEARTIIVASEAIRETLFDAPIGMSSVLEPALPTVAIVTAGSTDLPIAREALETLNWMDVPAMFLRDVGVAGLYRLLPHVDRLRSMRSIVAVAGMEGALPSVIGGLVPCPVVAVPTSVGYGANLSGVTTLLSMLSSCAASVTVVNIDAGFKGGYVAGLIASQS